MKTGINLEAFLDISLEYALDLISKSGLQTVNVDCGNENGFMHCNPKELLENPEQLNAFRSAFEKRNLQISALTCRTNPVSPNIDAATAGIEAMQNTVLLAEKLNVHTITCYSGCPGDCEAATIPNWITVNWPMDYAQAYEWQWEEKLIPFWKMFTDFARTHHVERIALSLQAGQCCYNPKTLKRLRDICGSEIGASINFGHLLWQRMDPVLVIRELKGMLFHLELNDIHIDKWQMGENGLISTTVYDNPCERSWNFRNLGSGHDAAFWQIIFSELRNIGYDGAASIELISHDNTSEDFSKASQFLRRCL